MNSKSTIQGEVRGEFVSLAGERYYAIRHVDQMPPFLISLVSDNDHWMFIASNGGLTAGRVSPDTALFPYMTVDKLYDSTPVTGSKTLLRINSDGQQYDWEPFNTEHNYRYKTSRNLYKSVLGNSLLFEEINHDLGLVFRYRWQCSDTYGFVRKSELENIGGTSSQIDLVDGLQNILPAGTPRFAQTNSSYLVDAYKWSELDEPTGLALLTLFSGITDRAEPCESLHATTVFCLGLSKCRVLLSDLQLDRFRHGQELTTENRKRGIRCAYFVNTSINLAPQSIQQWQIIANTEQSQSESIALQQQLQDKDTLITAIARSVAKGSDSLARIMASGDGLQLTAEENVATHHYANVLFNILRGGIVDNHYQINTQQLSDHIEKFNVAAYQQHEQLLEKLPVHIEYTELMSQIEQKGDARLHRLCLEYLPITFGRRHGDPSRPWNQFAIRLADERGDRLLTYEGNWRDIFQNWEALLLGYPEFIENVISKFVNASTVEGYNPYRISNEGIDWEVEEPDDPWSYIGYWGDHQIIYLLKLLELSRQFHPGRLSQLLHEPAFSYANVPYRIKALADVLKNPKSTVDYDEELALRIEKRVAQTGADGKLLLDSAGEVYQVNLSEKLLVPLLAKLGNLVVDGGIWLNTQRPEWNDANNALVGQGLSMVTLYYLRRYVIFLQHLLATDSDTVSLSTEVSQWLDSTAVSLSNLCQQLADGPITDQQRYVSMLGLGQAASDYREAIYAQESFSGTVLQQYSSITGMLADALTVIDNSIAHNRCDDGLYQAYNTLELKTDTAGVDNLYLMLEGQVAVLSSGAVKPMEAVRLLEGLFDSSLFRSDQKSFLLYPDRELPGFLQKNQLPPKAVESSSLLQTMLAQGDHRIVERDANGVYRFNGSLVNAGQLDQRLNELAAQYAEQVDVERESLRALYEQVFDHKSFTGRSGGMFGFEGLGSIYWHMVSKLLLAVQENYFWARESGADESVCQHLAQFYYRIRQGIGFNKTPAQYGAFPTDPYSHTPQHAGAQQPGMTGQVKEEMLTRIAELGVRVCDGAVAFDPSLLRRREFLDQQRPFRYLDVAGQWQSLVVPAQGLAFTWCQVPFVYRLDQTTEAVATVTWNDNKQDVLPDLSLSAAIASELFKRTGRLRQVEIVLSPDQLYGE